MALQLTPPDKLGKLLWACAKLRSADHLDKERRDMCRSMVRAAIARADKAIRAAHRKWRELAADYEMRWVEGETA